MDIYTFIGSLIAIALLALLAAKLFNRPAKLNDERVKKNMRRTYPIEVISRIIYSKNKMAALAVLDQDNNGFIYVNGDRIVCRILVQHPDIYKDLVTFESESITDSPHSYVFGTDEIKQISALYESQESNLGS